MSRFHVVSSSGFRSPLFPESVRATRSSTRLESAVIDAGIDTLIDSSPPTTTRVGRPRRTLVTKPSKTTIRYNLQEDDIGADASDEEEDDEDDDDGEEDADPPALYAPSRQNFAGEPGLFDSLSSEDEDYPDQEADVFAHLDYERVEEISDEDEDANAKNWDPEYFSAVAHQLVESREAAPELILNQSEGFSGFSLYGSDTDLNESDTLTSTSDGNEIIGDVSRPRRVHFANDENAFSHPLLGSVSPLLTRALLPSALPPPRENVATTIHSDLHDGQVGTPGNPMSHLHGYDVEDPYDSDATVPDLPPQASDSSAIEISLVAIEEADTPQSSTRRSETRRSNGARARGLARGPPRGFFTVEHDKPWGILDASGKKMIMVPASGKDCPPWLSEKILATMNEEGGPSAAASPSALLDESDMSVISGQDALDPDSNSTSQDITPVNSRPHDGVDGALDPVGDSTSIFQLPGGQIALGDMFLGAAEMESYMDADIEDDPDGDGDIPFDIEHFFSYGSDSDDEYGTGANSVYSPLAQQSSLVTPARAGNLEDEFPYLNPTNVTSFKRRADTMSGAFVPNPGLEAVSATAMANNATSNFHSLQTPRQTHKRKASDSPYQKAVYKGVTPIQRVLGTTKRRKVMT